MRLKLLKTLTSLVTAFLFTLIYLNIKVLDHAEPSARDAALLADDTGNVLPRAPDTSVRQVGHVLPDSSVGRKPQNHSVARPDEHQDMIYPSLNRMWDDRILNQLSFVPREILEKRKRGETVLPKMIFTFGGLRDWNEPEGERAFKSCSVTACTLTDDIKVMRDADVVLSKSMGNVQSAARSPNQIWVLFMLESPPNSDLSTPRTYFNWTATYRHDSTIVAPYEKFVPLNAPQLTRTPTRNYAAGKTKMVAWFVSNCRTSNKRMDYAKELAQHVQVDIYGLCGKHRCSRSEKGRCFRMLDTDYKFYLSFENSNCRDYITEKFFVNGLKHDVVPIVMGAAPEDYERAAPPHSYIHVDDFRSPKDLADYLHKLDQDDSLYNQYFAWKGLWDNINTHFWCRMCALAHDTKSRGLSWYSDVRDWWKGPNVCIHGRSWTGIPREREQIGDLAVTVKRP